MDTATHARHCNTPRDAVDAHGRALARVGAAERLGAPRFEAAAALEKAALAELQARRPDRVLATNVEFWAAVVLDFAEVPPQMFTPMFTCARTAGWSTSSMKRTMLSTLLSSESGKGSSSSAICTPREAA